MNSLSLENLQSIDPIEFENLVKTLLIKMGFHAVTTKASGDGGIDILATNEQPIIGGKYVVQCKRYSTGNNIGEPIIRELFGVMHAENANKGILITTSDFSKQAVIFAKDKAIELINGNELIRLFAKYFTEIDDTYIAADRSNNNNIGEFDNSFRGIDWGSKIEELTGFVCIYEAEDENENIKHYRRLNDKNTFGGSLIEGPYYYFNSNRFWSVMMKFNQWKNFEMILNYLINTLGKPSEEPEGLSIEYKWDGKIVDLALRYYPNDETGVVELINRTILAELLKRTHQSTANQESKQCFIATVIYESQLAFQVMELKKWRDNYLSKGWFGRHFIKFYYRIGPSVAECVANKWLLKKVLKWILNMVVELLQKNKHTGKEDGIKKVN